MDDQVPSPDDWRTWRRVGDYAIPPPGTTPEQCIAVMWPLACEKYGIDPDNPPPMRKDVARKFWRHELRDDEERPGSTVDD